MLTPQTLPAIKNKRLGADATVLLQRSNKDESSWLRYIGISFKDVVYKHDKSVTFLRGGGHGDRGCFVLKCQPVPYSVINTSGLSLPSLKVTFVFINILTILLLNLFCTYISLYISHLRKANKSYNTILVSLHITSCSIYIQ